MGIESYGGCCPRCARGMLNKYDSDLYAFLFDACPWCGFAHGSAGEPLTPDEVWESVLQSQNVNNRKELVALLKGYGVSEFCTEEESEFYPSVFDHSEEVFPPIEELEILQ